MYRESSAALGTRAGVDLPPSLLVFSCLSRNSAPPILRILVITCFAVFLPDVIVPASAESFCSLARSEEPREASHPAAHIHFADKTEESGLSSFQHRMGDLDKPWIIDAMGSGVAVGDYDNDGDDDIYFVNARPHYLKNDPNWTNALYRNEAGVFTNVTEITGVGDTGYGMCAVFGDVDNDGWLDLFVGNYGPNTLYRNNGDGTFSDVTSESNVEDDGYAASASFADVDRDGDLDLYVGNYVEFDPVTHGELRARYRGQTVFLGPMAFDAQADILYLNDGAGGFTVGSSKTGINISDGRAMGATFFDLDNDKNLDLYVTNDSTLNFILRNRGDGTFEDMSLISGGGFSDDGRGGASMGVSTGDYNNDGFLDIFVTSYQYETDTLYMNDGENGFIETTATAGLYGTDESLVTWGNGFCDFDSDGYLDIYTANGHVYPQVNRLDESYGQGVSIYRNDGKRFEDISLEAIPAEVMSCRGRGSALLDYDNDGDMDIVINCMDSAPILLENQSKRGNWLQVRLNGPSARTYGVRLVARKGTKSWTRIVDGGSGYLSQNSQTLHFGFGTVARIDSLTVYWPHCNPQIIASPELNTRILLDCPSCCR